MVIQRIQTLWLFLALVFTVVIGFRPIAWNADKGIFLSDAPVLLIIDALIAVLLFISIFTFKNLKLQKKITLLSMVLMAVLAVGGGFFLYNSASTFTLELMGGIVLLIISVILAMLAYRGMSKDQKLLRNADRLWS